MATRTRRTRFVCVSDTHNCEVKLPKGDVLIHAGDLTNQGSYSELSRAVRWLERADFEAKIVIAGNHDITLDAEFYSTHGASFHNKTPQSPAACLALLDSCSSITYLSHGSTTVRLTDPSGPRTQFAIFGSPYSPRVGLWAFDYPPSPGDPAAPPSSEPTTESLWAAIPSASDVVVTHTPPRGHVDAGRGCPVLRDELVRVRPRLAVCGHVHEARGAERVNWDGGGATPWEDISGAGGKIALVDLSGRTAGDRPLDNDGAGERRETCVVNCAVMANSYPHVGGKRFNKPIVVDLDLPVWEDGDG